MLNKVTLTVISMHAAFMVQAMPAGHALMDGNGIGGGHRRNIFSARPAGAPGLDVSRWEGPVDMAAQRDRGAAFVFVRATEGASTVDPTFEDHWPAARAAGLFRSAYHYAMPDRSSGDQQARFFLAHGGSGNASLAAAAVAQRKADQHQRVLPGMLDIEYNNETSRDACYGMRGQRMVNWIRAFVGTYHRATGAWPIIYTCVAVQGREASATRPGLCGVNSSACVLGLTMAASLFPLLCFSFALTPP